MTRTEIIEWLRGCGIRENSRDQEERERAYTSWFYTEEVDPEFFEAVVDDYIFGF